MVTFRTYVDAVNKPPASQSTKRMPSSKTRDSYGPKMSVKFVFKLKNDSDNNIANKHQSLLLTILEQQPSTKFFNSDGKQLTPEDIQEGTMSSLFDYALVKRRFSKTMVVCLDLLSPIPLQAMRRSISGQLRKAKAAILVNYWDTPDVRDVGWIFGIHPKYHSRDSHGCWRV